MQQKFDIYKFDIASLLDNFSCDLGIITRHINSNANAYLYIKPPLSEVCGSCGRRILFWNIF